MFINMYKCLAYYETGILKYNITIFLTEIINEREKYLISYNIKYIYLTKRAAIS